MESPRLTKVRFYRRPHSLLVKPPVKTFNTQWICLQSCTRTLIIMSLSSPTNVPFVLFPYYNQVKVTLFTHEYYHINIFSFLWLLTISPRVRVRCLYGISDDYDFSFLITHTFQWRVHKAVTHYTDNLTLQLTFYDCCKLRDIHTMLIILHSQSNVRFILVLLHCDIVYHICTSESPSQ